jgi:hypothetical protein
MSNDRNDRNDLQPPSVMLLGETGSGKTDSLATLSAAGLRLFVIVTEPGGVESLVDAHTRRGLSLDNLHYCYIPPTSAGWAAMTQMVETIANSSFESIQNIKAGVGKNETRQPALALLNALKNFKCDRTGQFYGDVSSFGSDTALAIDSLSGLSEIAWGLTVGYKPAAHQGEYGVAMNFIRQLLIKINGDRRCFFVLTSHVEKEVNEITGVQQIMGSTIGRKLAPKIPIYFSEVVLASKTITGVTPKFFWSTVAINTALKNRALPLSVDLSPSFEPLVAKFRERAKAAGTSARPTAEPVTPPQASPVNVPAAPLSRNNATR